MSKNKQEGDCTRSVGVICLAVFLVFSTFVHAVPPVAEDAVVGITDPGGTDVVLTATGDPTEYIVTSLPLHGWLYDPFDELEILETELPFTLLDNGNIVTYQPWECYVTGSDDFTFKASNPDGDSNVATISLDINLTGTIYEKDPTAYSDYYPLDTYDYKSRSQVIYHADELSNKAQTITSLALNVKTVPPIAVEGWTIRMKETSQAQYTSNQFDNTGVWTPVYTNANETISSAGWVEFVFQIPFEYDGTSNLMIDFSVDSATRSKPSDGAFVYLSATPEDRFVYKSASSGDPLSFTTADGRLQRLFNIKLQGDPAGTEELSADFDYNCSVDIADLVIMVNTWLLQEGDLDYNPDCDISIVVDNKVNLADFGIFASQWLGGG